jgi:SAM-dependent methyltransferase
MLHPQPIGQPIEAKLAEVAELAPSPNQPFYARATSAREIMNPQCFSREISQFLRDEREFLSKLLAEERYDRIVELGCHAGHNTSWLAERCGSYLGVDVDSGAIERAKRECGGRENVEFVCASVERSLMTLNHEHFERSLVLFPFNLFGNFSSVERLLDGLNRSGVDVAMSNFNTKSATTVGRYKYYVRCFGAASLRVYDAEQGVLFKAGNVFRSIAFSSEYLSNVIRRKSDFHSVALPFSIYGDLFILTK